MRINSNLPDHPTKEIPVHVDMPELDVAAAREIARDAVTETGAEAMLLSWHSKKTGEFYPRAECGGDDRPPWVVFAESRGANLIVDINDGDFRFYFLLL
ncbi:hypothetical protein D3OALGA1CA_1032 [Olavius algarvensis associated proteobacterium Delta 3]|nr:hypothetical protein D3OALGA1CA_1032 [Olavius algarvensis associated proteobacterium Delta 3]CAB5130855.1 hypothetical protein D3OALGB2SA_3622 [Olavius algarvensis associated proteobacterium Delta 3]